jgi:hypothetical protein
MLMFMVTLLRGVCGLKRASYRHRHRPTVYTDDLAGQEQISWNQTPLVA